MESSYHISRCKNGGLLVTVLTHEASSSFWKSLTNEIVRIKAKNCHIVFDFMFRNGLEDRFYEAYTDNNSSIQVSLRRFKATPSLIRFADAFFVNHKNLIEISALTKGQKIEYMNQ